MMHKKMPDGHDFPPTFGEPNVFAPLETGLVIEDVWPSLTIGAGQVPEMRRKTRDLPWAHEALLRWQGEAEIILHEPPAFEIAHTGGRCNLFTESGHHLLHDPQDATAAFYDPFLKEITPATPARLAGRVVLNHERTRRLMVSLGFLWKLTGDPCYAVWVRAGLDNLATLYESAARIAFDQDRNANENRFRLVYDGLYQAQCLLQVVQALELVQDAPGADAAWRARLFDAVLRPAGEKISAWMDCMIVHNMSCWSMAALAETGRVLGRADWIQKAVHSERCGLRMLLERGLPRAAGIGRPDGFWFEHSHFYACFYVIAPLIPLVRAAQTAGELTPDLRERFASLFDAPPVLADSELRLLSISDRTGPDLMRLTQMRYLYEYAAGQVDDCHAPLLALLYARCGAPRHSLAAVAFGPDALPPPAAPPALRQSTALPEAQVAVFRAQTPRGGATLWFANLKRYPGSAQGHHHLDKLAVSLHAFGEVVTSDMGWPGCETDRARVNFLSGTLSHNTLMLNEMDQGCATEQTFESNLNASVPWARGSFKGLTADGLWKTFIQHHKARLEDGLYDDARISRTVFFDFPCTILLDELDAGQGKRFGFCFHARGAMRAVAGSAPDAAALDLPALPDSDAWSLFQGRQTADPVAVFTADWRLRADLFLRLTTVSDGPFDAAWGRIPDNPSEIISGLVVLRAPGKRRRFATVLELHEGTPTVAGLSLDKDTVWVRPYVGSGRAYKCVSD